MKPVKEDLAESLWWVKVMRTCQRGGGKAAHVNQYLFVVLRMQIAAFIVHFIWLLWSSLIRSNQVPEMLIDIHLYTVYWLGKQARFIFCLGLVVWLVAFWFLRVWGFFWLAFFFFFLGSINYMTWEVIRISLACIYQTSSINLIVLRIFTFDYMLLRTFCFH